MSHCSENDSSKIFSKMIATLNCVGGDTGSKVLAEWRIVVECSNTSSEKMWERNSITNRNRSRVAL